MKLRPKEEVELGLQIMWTKGNFQAEEEPQISHSEGPTILLHEKSPTRSLQSHLRKTLRKHSHFATDSFGIPGTNVHEEDRPLGSFKMAEGPNAGSQGNELPATRAPRSRTASHTVQKPVLTDPKKPTGCQGKGAPDISPSPWLIFHTE